MNSFGFDPSVPVWIVALVLLLAVISVWFEIKKKVKFLAGRLVAVILLGLSLLGFMFKPFYETQSTKEILLLTPGYKPAQIDSLLKQNKHLTIMHTKDCGDIKNSQLIDDDFFETRGGGVKMILGEGLSPSILETMPAQNFQFISSEPQGVVKLSLPIKVIENEASTLKGVMNGVSDSRLRLIGPTGVEDSMFLKKGGNQQFELSFTPKQRGKFLFQLEIITGNTISQEPIPVDVPGASPLKILFLQKYPNAETKSLKNFLAERSHSVTLRYQVSKEVYSYEFVNATESRINAVSHKLLNGFDLLFIDISTLNTLSQNEKRELVSALRKGLGVVVLQNEDVKNLQWFWPLNYKANNKDTTHLNLSPTKKYILQALPFEATSEREIYPIITSGTRNLSGYILQGNGKIAFMLLQETYRIKIEGNEKDYAVIWNSLITKTARKKQSDWISISSSFPIYQHEPFNVDVLSQESILFSDTAPMPLREDLVIDDFWHTRVWIDKPGWHVLKTKNEALHYFVLNDSSWKSLRIANRILETKKAASNDNSLAAYSVERREVPQFIFFLLFLISAGFLWLVPKLS